jgi:enamine deaminase RidA (YjgF/YER057c/UK114 family)
MKDKQIIQPPGWAPPKGYVNGIAGSGRLLFIAGQIGWDPTSTNPRFPRTFAAQFEAALENVLAVLKQAGGNPDDLVRMTVYVKNKKAYLAALRPIGEAWKRMLGRSYPAMTLVEVKSLLEPKAQVEIEATALL